MEGEIQSLRVDEDAVPEVGQYVLTDAGRGGDEPVLGGAGYRRAQQVPEGDRDQRAGVMRAQGRHCPVEGIGHQQRPGLLRGLPDQKDGPGRSDAAGVGPQQGSQQCPRGGHLVIAWAVGGAGSAGRCRISGRRGHRVATGVIRTAYSRLVVSSS
jgi:hypothetical protein